MNLERNNSDYETLLLPHSCHFSILTSILLIYKEHKSESNDGGTNRSLGYNVFLTRG